MTRLGWLSLVLSVACGGDDPSSSTTGPLEDLATEPCNGRDDDGDGLLDEGNDADGDGVPDCFDTEECDGLDNDGDGLVDEDTDVDGDGVGDCLDVEECDDVDNDGDGEIDEDFPEGCDPCNGVDDDGDGEIDEDGVDTDEDGIPDCLDAEECDGLDNDGDGEIDEDTDADFDGLCDEDDVEVCDGWDNDGDGLRDEGFDGDGDGVPDCWIPEWCDGVDNDGDGEIDEDFADLDGDGLVDCSEACPAPTEYTVCEVTGATVNCSYGQPVFVVATTLGTVLDVDMTSWRSLAITGHLQDAAGIVLTVADSPTCNGFGGDAGTSVYDAEGQLDDGGWQVYGTASQPGALLAPAAPVVAAEDDVAVQVCDGWIGFGARSGGYAEVSGATLFQVDGNEPDYERASGVNDRVLHVGIGRTIADPTRNGTGIGGVVLVLSR